MEMEYEICFIMCTIAEFVFFLIEIITPTKTENAVYRLMYQNLEISRYVKIMELFERISLKEHRYLPRVKMGIAKQTTKR